VSEHRSFSHIVFAGGGGRCIWQVGFWQALSSVMELQPKSIAAVSAGAAMATFLIGGAEDAALEAFSSRIARNEKNAYWGHLFQRGKKVFPQAKIYRDALLEVYTPEVFERIKSGPEIRMLLARPPRWMGPYLGAMVGVSAYKLEKKLHKPLHPLWGTRLGFLPWVVSTHDCETPEALAELVLQSSCTPPFTPLLKREGQIVLDGGLVDNVPVIALPEEAKEEETLVMLSRPYPPSSMLAARGRVYVQPSRVLPVSTWDYTSPEKLVVTHELGLRDGEAFAATL